MFSRPYQSDTATLRHFLIANAGVSYTKMEQVLRRKVSGSNTIDRIKNIYFSFPEAQIDKLLNVPSDSNRQCAQCATQFYHCDLYNLTWLPRCPIHNQSFTAHCPACKQPWPNPHELPHRICPVCGLFYLGPSMPPIELISKQMCRSLSTLIAFINYKASDDYFLSTGEMLGHCWWPYITVNHRLFPACQLARHPRITKNYLEKMGVNILPVRKKITKLTKITNHQFKKKSFATAYFADINNNLLRCQYDVFKLILKVLLGQSGKSHPIHICSYRYTTMQNVMEGPSPCPLCMALSLWFFHIASWEYGFNHYIGTDIYPFLRDLGYQGFYFPFGFTQVSDHFETYKVSTSFTEWSYKRSLELSFIDIYLMVLFLLKRHQTDDYHPHRRYGYDTFNRKFISGDYFLDFSKTQATIYYEAEHPVQHLECYVRKISPVGCRKYRSYISRVMDARAKFEYSLYPAQFTYRDYFGLHTLFKEFLQLPPPKYSRGSSPIWS